MYVLHLGSKINHFPLHRCEKQYVRRMPATFFFKDILCFIYTTIISNLLFVTPAPKVKFSMSIEALGNGLFPSSGQ